MSIKFMYKTLQKDCRRIVETLQKIEGYKRLLAFAGGFRGYPPNKWHFVYTKSVSC